MKTAGEVALVYGGLVLAGGLIGYLTAGSVASVVAGAVFGVLLMSAGAALLKGKMIGLYGGLALAALLTAFFGYRFWQGGVFMPSGVMAALSLAAVVVFLITWRRAA